MKLQALKFCSFIMYCWHVFFLRRWMHNCAVKSVEFAVKISLGGPYCGSFSIFCINSVYNGWGLRSLCDHCLIWESELAIGKLANKYVKGSTWGDVHAFLGCWDTSATLWQGLRHFKPLYGRIEHEVVFGSWFDDNLLATRMIDIYSTMCSFFLRFS